MQRFLQNVRTYRTTRRQTPQNSDLQSVTSVSLYPPCTDETNVFLPNPYLSTLHFDKNDIYDCIQAVHVSSLGWVLAKSVLGVSRIPATSTEKFQRMTLNKRIKLRPWYKVVKQARCQSGIVIFILSQLTLPSDWALKVDVAAQRVNGTSDKAVGKGKKTAIRL